MADVRLETVCKTFDKTEAVRELSLEIGDGEFVVLLGPTGAGKTTTLRLVAGLERPDAGRVAIAGRDVTAAPPAMRDVTFVFQQYSLYPHLSVFDNLAFPLRSPVRRSAPAEINRKVREVARLLHIEDKLQNRATQLSGGQMQRVAIGRALIRSPAVYLMDEPLSSLDAKLRGEMRIELRESGQRLRRDPAGLARHQPRAALDLPDDAGAGGGGDHRGTHRARAHPQGGERPLSGNRVVDRAFGRSGPPPYRARRARFRDLERCRLGSFGR